MGLRGFFNKEEYKRLLTLTFLGDWVVNAHRAEDHRKDYEEVADKILAFAGQFGLDQYVDRTDESGRLFPSKLLEDEALEFMEEHDQDFFWEELVSRLADRDMARKFGAERMGRMSWEEKFRHYDRFEEKYDREFVEKGLDRFEVRRGVFWKRFWPWKRREQATVGRKGCE